MLLDAFLKLEPKPEGGSTDELHPKQIEILSVEQAIFRISAEGGEKESSTARSELAPLRVIKVLDKTSAKLLEAACSGTPFTKATICFCQPSATADTTSGKWERVDYFEIVLQEVRIIGIRLLGNPRMHYSPLGGSIAGDLGPVEELDLSFRKIQWTYKAGKGDVVGCWNLNTNTNKLQ